MNNASNHVNIAHRVTFGKMPINVVERIVHASISVVWDGDEWPWKSENPDAMESMRELMAAVNDATQYTVPVYRDTGEPVEPA